MRLLTLPGEVLGKGCSASRLAHNALMHYVSAWHPTIQALSSWWVLIKRVFWSSATRTIDTAIKVETGRTTLRVQNIQPEKWAEVHQNPRKHAPRATKNLNHTNWKTVHQNENWSLTKQVPEVTQTLKSWLTRILGEIGILIWEDFKLVELEG